MDQRIKTVLDHVEDNLGTDLDLESLSSIACLSKSQFHRLFRSETGTTPFKFLEALKMEKAHALILRGETLVSDVAESLRYNDYETFTRAFKKHFGLSPDDLKSIVNAVRSEVRSESGVEVLVRTIDSEKEVDSLFTELQSHVESTGITMDELENSRVFKILKKEDQVDSDATLIKNKYVMDQDQKLWQKLLNNWPG